jgi:hypothetical protein
MSEINKVAKQAQKLYAAYEAIAQMKQNLGSEINRAFITAKVFQDTHGFRSASKYNWITYFTGTEFEIENITEDGVWFSDGNDYLLTFDEIENMGSYLEVEYNAYKKANGLN